MPALKGQAIPRAVGVHQLSRATRCVVCRHRIDADAPARMVAGYVLHSACAVEYLAASAVRCLAGSSRMSTLYCPHGDHDGAKVSATRAVFVADGVGGSSRVLALCAYCAEGQIARRVREGYVVTVWAIVNE